MKQQINRFMFLTKGNDRKLKGIITVYAELYEEGSFNLLEPEYLGVFASTNIDDFKDLAHEPNSEISVIYNDVLDEQEQQVDFYEEDFFLCELFEDKRENLPLDKGDVKFVGSSFDYDLALKKVDSCLEIYIKKYSNQILSLLPPADYYYKIFPSVFLKKTFYDTYITPLRISVQRRNDKLKEAIVRRLNLFTGEEFPSDINFLVDIVCDSIDNPTENTFKLVKYNVNKLVALCEENYKEAAFLRDKIKELYSRERT